MSWDGSFFSFSFLTFVLPSLRKLKEKSNTYILSSSATWSRARGWSWDGLSEGGNGEQEDMVDSAFKFGSRKHSDAVHQAVQEGSKGWYSLNGWIVKQVCHG